MIFPTGNGPVTSYSPQVATLILRRIENRNFEVYLLALNAGDYDKAREYTESLVVLHDLIGGMVPLKGRSKCVGSK